MPDCLINFDVVYRLVWLQRYAVPYSAIRKGVQNPFIQVLQWKGLKMSHPFFLCIISNNVNQHNPKVLLVKNSLQRLNLDFYKLCQAICKDIIWTLQPSVELSAVVLLSLHKENTWYWHTSVFLNGKNNPIMRFCTEDMLNILCSMLRMFLLWIQAVLPSTTVLFYFEWFCRWPMIGHH